MLVGVQGDLAVRIRLRFGGDLSPNLVAGYFQKVDLSTTKSVSWMKRMPVELHDSEVAGSNPAGGIPSWFPSVAQWLEHRKVSQILVVSSFCSIGRPVLLAAAGVTNAWGTTWVAGSIPVGRVLSGGSVVAQW